MVVNTVNKMTLTKKKNRNIFSESRFFGTALGYEEESRTAKMRCKHLGLYVNFLHAHD